MLLGLRWLSERTRREEAPNDGIHKMVPTNAGPFKEKRASLGKKTQRWRVMKPMRTLPTPCKGILTAHTA